MSLLFVLFIGLAQLAAEPPQQPDASARVAEQVEFVLFTDFQCPFCARFAAAYRELEGAGVAGVTVRFKHFPLNIHPAAPLAHQAALAAGEQGKFWAMHDLLFAHQATAKREDLLQYAAQLGLDAERFKRDLDSDRLKQIIEADLAEGLRLRVQGTPTFFVNGRAYSGAFSAEQLKQLVLREQQRKLALAEVTDKLLSRGPLNAPVTLEFFADLQSPVSLPALKVLDELSGKYATQVRVQFRNFPLAFHPQAPLAHEAAMAAAARGRFWEFARYLLEHPEGLREQDLIALAGRLGLEAGQFAVWLKEHRYAAKIEADLEMGGQRGLRGSPVVFVNQRRIDGVPSLEQLVEYVESELAAIPKQEARRP